MEFVLIPAGEFLMGSDKRKDPEARDEETPLHRVTISRPFYLGKYAVTQDQWEAVMESNPSKFKGRSNPVETVSWDEVQEFIRRLNIQEGNGCYRLPTEAEWEYACRGGTTGVYSFGDNAGSLGHYAWYADNSGEKPHPVGQKRPNAWGLYDMHGNVWEWVQDWYCRDYYSDSPSSDPRGLSSGSYRVRRGGCWYSVEKSCRSANRYYFTPDYRYDVLGFRLALYPTGAIRGPYNEDTVRGLLSDKIIQQETEIWSSLDKTKDTAGTSARFAGYFPQRIVLDSSDSPPDKVDVF